MTEKEFVFLAMSTHENGLFQDFNETKRETFDTVKEQCAISKQHFLDDQDLKIYLGLFQNS